MEGFGKSPREMASSKRLTLCSFGSLEEEQYKVPFPTVNTCDMTSFVSVNLYHD